MEYRRLGRSGLMVPQLTLGTAMFVPTDVFPTGNIDQKSAQRMVDLAIDYGANMFDTAHSYWDGQSELMLGNAIQGKRHEVLISAKIGQPSSDSGPNDLGASRHHLTRALDASLKRLGTDYVDILHLHTFDAITPVEETLATLDTFVRAGKVRYIGASNMPGWALMKALAAAERDCYPRYVVHQIYYSLIGRDYEWDLMPLGIDQDIAAAVWSPLGWGRLSGKLQRGRPLPRDSRLAFSGHLAPAVDDALLYRVLDVLHEIAAETGMLVPQIAINWLLRRPTVATVIIGARNEEQLINNLGSTGWILSTDQIARLDAASQTPPSYPTSFYRTSKPNRNPEPV